MRAIWGFCMDKVRRCIFHVPYEPNPSERPSGTNVRPGKMLQGFKDAGFEVFEIIGDSRMRKRAIAEAKRLILAGESFDFLYSESETIPTMLTDADHLPRHPLMDFSFMRFCRSRGIPVGLFYRDAHWLSSEFERLRKGLYGRVATRLHRFDLKQYETAADVMFVPSDAFGAFLEQRGVSSLKKIPLPSGCLPRRGRRLDQRVFLPESQLNFVYVGGISYGEGYDLSNFISGVSRAEGVHLDLCVRDYEWANVGRYYEPLMCDTIKIHHASGDDLENLYAGADIGILVYQPTPYRSLSMPVKLFEYLGEGLPVLTLRDTAAGDFVQGNAVGWTVGPSECELSKMVEYLRDHPDEIARTRDRCIEVAQANTWRIRALEVARALSNDINGRCRHDDE